MSISSTVSETLPFLPYVTTCDLELSFNSVTSVQMTTYVLVVGKRILANVYFIYDTLDFRKVCCCWKYL